MDARELLYVLVDGDKDFPSAVPYSHQIAADGSPVSRRPQFIKAAPVSRALRAMHTEILVHTGQHYDAMMWDVFFNELGIPTPDITLNVGLAPHGAQTGCMLEGIETVLLQQKPDAVRVYGDTNSTLAGALAAAKLGIWIVHVEAGLRSSVRNMPEEINRVLTDRLSTLYCCPSDTARINLAAAGITEGVIVVGDVMLDALTDTAARVAHDASRLVALGVAPSGYLLATVHRAANTDNPARLRAIIAAFGAVAEPVLWPMHPRTRHVRARRDHAFGQHSRRRATRLSRPRRRTAAGACGRHRFRWA